MRPLTREWIEKAEADFATAYRESRVRRSPNYDAVCFHAQQCAEKYLKAHLQEASLQFPKTHDLPSLLELLLPTDPLLETLRPALNALSTFAVEVRYPGESATRKQALEALSHCRHVRAILRERLGLTREGKTRKSHKQKGKGRAKR
jgi:HEPN domain-containing protein